MKTLLLALCLSVLGLMANAQSGLESIYVERYYVSDANDATYGSPALPVGSVTYRIYADMQPGYKLQSVYGSPQHNLLMNTTGTEFYNCDFASSATGFPTVSTTNTKKNTMMVDSWLTTGGACNGYVGVPKTEDDGVGTFVNSNVPKLLQNNDAQAGIALTTQDGLLAGTVPTSSSIGLDAVIGVFGDGSANGNSFLVTNGAWSCLTGASGPFPATSNRVLIAQITTDGIFHFELNIQIGTPTNGTEKYVSSNPAADEFTIPSLTQTLYPAPCPSTTWTGAVSTDWFNSGNWNSCVPQPTTDVTIPVVATHYPTITGSASCASLTIESGASLIGSEFLTAGNALVKRDFPAASYHYISSPVQSTTFNSVFPLAQNAVWAYSYEETSGDWINKTTSDNLAVGTGYSVRMTDAQTAQFIGQLNKLPVTASLSSLNSSGISNRVGWNLLGNPFTSAIDWNSLVKGAGVDGAVYVWNGSGYISYNAGIGALTGGIIPAMNGFFVKTTVNGSNVTIPLSSRVHSTTAFYKESITNLVSLKVKANGYEDQTFVHLDAAATSAYDPQFDAYKLMGIDEAPELYSSVAGEIMSINVLPLEGNEVVNLGFKCGLSGTYELTASGMESFDASVPVLLEDVKTGVIQNLRTNPVYSFTYTSGDSDERFKLRFKSSTGLDENAADGVQIFGSQQEVVIRNTTDLSGEVVLYSLNGREIMHAVMNGVGETHLPVNVAEGAYLVKIQTVKGITTEKVYIR
jgi:hypothetical protein